MALYQSGEVPYLVATDAIGMGLNLDVDHVAFSGLQKFDGQRLRALAPDELAQIAGRAGRYKKDGSFGLLDDVEPLDSYTIAAIEHHRFASTRHLSWRNSDLDLHSPQQLLDSLARPPGKRVRGGNRFVRKLDALDHRSSDREPRHAAAGLVGPASKRAARDPQLMACCRSANLHGSGDRREPLWLRVGAG